MVFNTISFLLFFPAFFFAYWAINNRARLSLRNLFIILASYLFYGWWDWRFLILIVISSTVDFVIGVLLEKDKPAYYRKILLASSIAVNIGLLGFFKYFNFFIDSLNALFESLAIEVHTATLEIILPVGISFYTFQTLSYTIDVYRRRMTPTRDVLAFFAFVSFFPQLVAGPIERANHLLPQFQVEKTFNYATSVAGLRLILWGFFKKVVIADNFGVLADSIFAIETDVSGIAVCAGAMFFALQIYADFSGYSDIAIGLAKLLGFDLKANFSTPYFAHSFREFWRRWHISLSSWFRDYVYIPLGGNRSSAFRVNLNILITFVLSGLWHGANVTFLIWGGLHGLALMLEKQLGLTRGRRSVYAVFVLVMVVLLWLPFRAENYAQLQDLVRSLGDFQSYSLTQLNQIIADFSAHRFYVLLAITALFGWVESRMQLNDFNQWIGQKSKATRITTYYVLVLLMLLIGNFSVKPSFIYFQF